MRTGACAFLLAAGLALHAAPASQEPLRIDGGRLIANLERLAAFGGTQEGGTHRVAYSDEDLAARVFVVELMAAAGLEVSVDGVGNLRAATATTPRASPRSGPSG